MIAEPNVFVLVPAGTKAAPAPGMFRDGQVCRAAATLNAAPGHETDRTDRSEPAHGGQHVSGEGGYRVDRVEDRLGVAGRGRGRRRPSARCWNALWVVNLLN